jgi:hypothetical protein
MVVMPILYVETNFLMSIALGRDAEAGNLLLNPPASLEIAVPEVCCMESLSAFESEQKRRFRFNNELNQLISQLRRDLTSASASSLLSYLDMSLEENENLLNDIKKRLFIALESIAANATTIPLSPEIIRGTLSNSLIFEEPTDNLILQTILSHARTRPTEVKILLTGNIKDFTQPNVKEALQNAGINLYFSRTSSFIGWLASQSG